MATKTASKKTLNSIKNTVKSVNNFVLETTEVLVDEGFAAGQKWQKLTEKAIKSGLELTEKQTDITFKALEAVKNQVVKGQKKFKTTFSKN